MYQKMSREDKPFDISQSPEYIRKIKENPRLFEYENDKIKLTGSRVVGLGSLEKLDPGLTRKTLAEHQIPEDVVDHLIDSSQDTLELLITSQATETTEQGTEKPAYSEVIPYSTLEELREAFIRAKTLAEQGRNAEEIYDELIAQ